ncbi:MAG: response regulator [Peptococcaceae bacterium]|nr:response regulator [Peptococcaceae bacterium]
MKYQQRCETKDIPVIAISANAMEKDIEKALKAGFAEYIIKPINVVKFLEVVSVYLKEKEQN